MGRHDTSSSSSCSRSAEANARSRWSDSSASDSSTSASGSYSQSEEEDAELEQYQEALYNLEQQRDAVRLLSVSLSTALGFPRVSHVFRGLAVPSI